MPTRSPLEKSQNILTRKQNPALLLVGTPGVGKTTVIKKTIELSGNIFDGFYTQELRQNNQRIGFEIITLDGQQALLATKEKKVNFLRQAKFGEYTVNIDAIESVAVPSFLKAVTSAKVAVIDEIGPMEIFSKRFCSAVLEILDYENITVLGTIVQRHYNFTDSVKRHPRVRVQEVNMNNRHVLPQWISDRLFDLIRSFKEI
jgi:nucleoside-triphosphatase THEP1